jgi:hypothetical protein
VGKKSLTIGDVEQEREGRIDNINENSVVQAVRIKMNSKFNVLLYQYKKNKQDALFTFILFQ